MQKSKENIIQAISTTGFQDVLAPKLQELEAKISSITTNLIELNHCSTPIIVIKTMVKEYFSKFSDFIKFNNLPQIKKLIHTYVERVDVYKDKITVTFKVAFDFTNDADSGLKYTFDITVERVNLVA